MSLQEASQTRIEWVATFNFWPSAPQVNVPLYRTCCELAKPSLGALIAHIFFVSEDVPSLTLLLIVLLSGGAYLVFPVLLEEVA